MGFFYTPQEATGGTLARHVFFPPFADQPPYVLMARVNGVWRP